MCAVEGCRAVVEGLYSSFSLQQSLQQNVYLDISRCVLTTGKRPSNTSHVFPIPYSSHVGSHGDAQKAPWVAYGHAQSDSDNRLTANPGRLAVELLQQFLQQKDCCRGLYSSHTLSHGLISSATVYREDCATPPPLRANCAKRLQQPN